MTNPLEKFQEQKLSLLEEQVKNPEIHTLAGQEVEVYDVSPEELASEVPVVIGLAWSTDIESYEKCMRELAKRGRRSLCVNTPHGIDYQKLGEEKSEELDAGDFPAAELRKTAALRETLEAKSLEKVDLVAHSEAGIFMTIFANLYPEKVRSITYVDAAGMIGDDNVLGLGVRFSIEIMREVINGIKNKEKDPNKGGVNFLASLKVVGSKPVRSLQEIFAIANADIRNMMENLRAKGIRILVIHDTQDDVFKMEKVQETITGKHVDGFYSVEGGGKHNGIILEPGKYTMVINEGLDALDKMETKNKDNET